MTDICSTLHIPDVNNTFVSKTVIKEAIFNHHYTEMKSEIDRMKKLEPIKGEDFTETLQYVMDKFIENGLMSFQIRTQMLKDIPGKYPKRQRKTKMPQQVLTQSHYLECPGWMDIKKGY